MFDGYMEEANILRFQVHKLNTSKPIVSFTSILFIAVVCIRVTINY